MPDWHFREVHTIEVDAFAETVFRAVDELTWREVPVFRLLMAVRFVGRDPAQDPRVFASMTKDGFTVLDRLDDELVVGTLCKGLKGSHLPLGGSLPGEVLRDFDERGHVKIAFNFRRCGSTLTTETRVCATDARTRRLFRMYWLVIRGPSGLIRRIWLRAIRERAENEPVFL